MDQPVHVRVELLPPTRSSDVEAFDYTKLTAINTCPTWGIIRYGMHKRMPTQYADHRSMPLEAGQAAHDAFAAIRLAQLWRTHPDHARHHATRVFGAGRAETLLAVIRHADTPDAAIRAVGVEAIATSGFTDSDYDRRRTVANLEASITAYATGYDYDRWPVWIADERVPTDPIGVEQPFAILVTYVYADGRQQQVRLTGKIDGIHWHREVGSELQVHENKTTSRIDDAWIQSFAISHQVTGYCVAGSLLTGVDIGRAVVRGVQLPLPKMVIQGLHDNWLVRDNNHRGRWFRWILHTIGVYYEHLPDPVLAPRYTHSCNRYFRPCPFIPFCDADTDEQRHMLAEELVTDEWSPLAEEYDA